jgi:hypothetical protein
MSDKASRTKSIALQNLMICYTQTKMEKHDKEGAIYILAIIGFIASILILVSLTHVIY